MARDYPLRSKVKVIAREARLLPNKPTSANIRLEISPDTWGNISRNYYEDGRQMLDGQGVFDYKSFKQVTSEDYVAEFMPFLDAKGALPEFELRKDLLRLRKAKSKNERMQIIERLMYYPICCGGFSYYGIAKTYLRNPRLVRSLSDKREAWINETNKESP